MLRSLRKRIRAKRLGTPIKTGEGKYQVPCTEYVRADGETHYEIDAKSIKMVIIADELGTDDPDVIMREYTRREFVAYVRRETETEDERRRAKTAGPQLPPVYHKAGKIIPFPGTEAKSSLRMSATVPVKKTVEHPSETLGRANTLARPADVMSSEEVEPEQIPVLEPAPIVEIPVERQPTEAELIADAVEGVLKEAKTDEERRLLSEFISAHSDYIRSAALDSHVKMSLCVQDGIVRAHYAWRSQAVCEA